METTIAFVLNGIFSGFALYGMYKVAESIKTKMITKHEAISTHSSLPHDKQHPSIDFIMQNSKKIVGTCNRQPPGTYSTTSSNMHTTNSQLDKVTITPAMGPKAANMEKWMAGAYANNLVSLVDTI